MPRYVALLRGIGPGNPNMRNDKLRELFEFLGFDNVQSVISSGNILFESSRADKEQMEQDAESAFPEQLGYNCTTIIRSHADLEKIVSIDPFKGLTHGPTSYLLVTFLKHPQKMPFELPYQPDGKPYKIIGATGNALFTVTDNTVMKTTDLMTWLEQQFGRQITSRTWLTIERIIKKLPN